MDMKNHTRSDKRNQPSIPDRGWGAVITMIWELRHDIRPDLVYGGEQDEDGMGGE